MNKSIGPGGQPLFDWSAEASPLVDVAPLAGLSIPEAQDATKDVSTDSPKDAAKNRVRIDQLEGFGDDPTFTKVVDRRWDERNKHIYPASTWQEFDPEKDYRNEIRRDLGGNAFFFAKS